MQNGGGGEKRGNGVGEGARQREARGALEEARARERAGSAARALESRREAGGADERGPEPRSSRARVASASKLGGGPPRASRFPGASRAPGSRRAGRPGTNLRALRDALIHRRRDLRAGGAGEGSGLGRGGEHDARTTTRARGCLLPFRASTCIRRSGGGGAPGHRRAARTWIGCSYFTSVVMGGIGMVATREATLRERPPSRRGRGSGARAASRDSSLGETPPRSRAGCVSRCGNQARSVARRLFAQCAARSFSRAATSLASGPASSSPRAPSSAPSHASAPPGDARAELDPLALATRGAFARAERRGRDLLTRAFGFGASAHRGDTGARPRGSVSRRDVGRSDQ